MRLDSLTIGRTYRNVDTKREWVLLGLAFSPDREKAYAHLRSEGDLDTFVIPLEEFRSGSYSMVWDSDKR